MAANTNPIYSKAWTPVVSGAIIGPNANTSMDGTGANMYLVFTADATEGSFVYRVLLRPVGTIAATVARLYLCTDTGTFTAGTTNTATNTALLGELGFAAVTQSNTLGATPGEIPLMFGLAASQKLLMSFGTSTGSAGNGFNPVVIAGKY